MLKWSVFIKHSNASDKHYEVDCVYVRGLYCGSVSTQNLDFTVITDVKNVIKLESEELGRDQTGATRHPLVPTWSRVCLSRV